jgi:hypothetical protein
MLSKTMSPSWLLSGSPKCHLKDPLGSQSFMSLCLTSSSSPNKMMKSMSRPQINNAIHGPLNSILTEKHLQWRNLCHGPGRHQTTHFAVYYGLFPSRIILTDECHLAFPLPCSSSTKNKLIVISIMCSENDQIFCFTMGYANCERLPMS